MVQLCLYICEYKIVECVNSIIFVKYHTYIIERA